MEPVETKPAETDKPAQDAAVDVKALADQLEQIKKTQAGSDKAYQESVKKALALESELEKLKKEKMSEKEKAEYELARQKAEIEAKSKEVAEATLRLSKMKILGEKKVSVDFAEYISGSTEEEIRVNLDTFIKRFDEAVAKRVDEKLSGNTPPKAGEVTNAPVIPKNWREMENAWRGR